MVQTRFRGPWSETLNGTLEKIRERGRDTLRTALGTAETTPPASLPKLQGEQLARHHLRLAFAALYSPGGSKPKAFAKLRLLVNGLEQGQGASLGQPVSVPKGPQTLPLSSRRIRLIARAVEGAHFLASRHSGRDRAKKLHFRDSA